MGSSAVKIIRGFSFITISIFMVHCSGDDLLLRGRAKNNREESVSLTGPSTSIPSAKAIAAFSNVAIMDQGDTAYTTILSQSLKSSNRSLFIDMSLECGLLTKTLVSSKKGVQDTSTASAAVMVRVMVDGKQAAPGEVTYCRRTQELSATFGGILQSCTDANGDGTILSSECQFTDEQLSLLLSTMNAASFNFISDNLASGVHKIDVQAKIFSTTSAQAGTAEARGFIGKGTVLINSERLAR